MNLREIILDPPRIELETERRKCKADRTPPCPYTVKGTDGAELKIRHYRFGKYHSYRFRHHADGRPSLVTFSKFHKAKFAAEQVLTRIANHQTGWLSLTNKDAFNYQESLLNLAGFDKPLPQVAAEWAEARSRLNREGLGEWSILEAVSYCARQNRGVKAKTFLEACAEFIEAKEAARDKGDLSGWYVSSLRTRLAKFKTVFRTEHMGEINSLKVREFLATQGKLSLKSKSNLVEALNSLFKWAKARAYLPREFDEFRKSDLLEAKPKAKRRICLYRPKELSDLLSHADELEAVFLAIAAFAGIRTAEFLRLEWQDLKFDSGSQGNIQVSDEDAKTQSRRLIPMLPALKNWLPGDAGQRCGLIWPHSQAYLHERMAGGPKSLCGRAGVDWKRNALRHSFISYRLAATMNKEQVAIEAGNSPRIIDQNYKELVTIEDAHKWFAIQPSDGAQQVLQLL